MMFHRPSWRDLGALLRIAVAPEPKPPKVDVVAVLAAHLLRVIRERDAFDAELRAAEAEVRRLMQVIERRERVLSN